MSSPSSNGLLDAILDNYQTNNAELTHRRGYWPDRHGDYWALCPHHPDTSPGSFSVGLRGWYCFTCRRGGSLADLTAALGLATSGAMPSPAPRFVRRIDDSPAKAPLPAWRREPDIWRHFLALPPEVRDYYHRRGFNDISIERWHLGYGFLPGNQHTKRWPRLILPVFHDGKLTGLKGRAFHTMDTGAKWLHSYGSESTLFGRETLGLGKTLIVAEAPYSAILAVQECPWLAAVAPTHGAGAWEDAWSLELASLRPPRVEVWYDNDYGGQSNAVKVLNSLLAAGIRQVYQKRWPEGTAEKADLADSVVAWQSRSSVERLPGHILVDWAGAQTPLYSY